MARFHAILTDETGHGEFGITIDAETLADAWDQLEEDYPECRVTQVKSYEEEQREREARMYRDDYYDDDYGY